MYIIYIIIFTSTGLKLINQRIHFSEVWDRVDHQANTKTLLGSAKMAYVCLNIIYIYIYIYIYIFI